MTDWTKSMKQTFEYRVVDPGTWEETEVLDSVRSCTINRDKDVPTLGSASIEIDNLVGECYVRVYLITIQNGIRDEHPLGTFLVQTPSSKFTGSVRTISMDAYTPLLELKEKNLPFGYSILKGRNIMDIANNLVRENLRAPVVETNTSDKLTEDFVANTDDTVLTFATDLIAKAEYELGLDELSRVIFVKKQDTASLRPVFTYTDDNSSILYSEVTMNHDMYEIPNVVEVIYSNSDINLYAKATNNNSNSPSSTVSRGRTITHRITNPSLPGEPTQYVLNEYAENMLRELSSVEYTITYTHGYCPVRLGDCVQFDYTRAGLTGIKAKVISQSIKCEPGCPVTEKATFTSNLWG